MSQYSTEETGCRFSVKEADTGELWIMIEEDAPGLSVLRDGFIGLRLHSGVDLTQAVSLAKLLGDYVSEMTLTRFT